MLDAKIRAVGNSLGIIIPGPVLKMLDLNKGDKVRIDKKGCNIILSKVEKIDDKD